MCIGPNEQLDCSDYPPNRYVVSIMYCPKCGSEVVALAETINPRTNVYMYDDNPFFVNEIRKYFSIECYSCGFRLYGDSARYELDAVWLEVA